MMSVTRYSIVSARDNTMELDVTQEMLDEWQAGAKIQDVMPHLSADEREFLISGLLPHEFDALCTDWEEEGDFM